MTKLIGDYRAKTKTELTSLLEDKKKDMLKVQAELLGQKEKNLKKAKQLRLEIAQISTIIREKEIVETLEGGN